MPREDGRDRIVGRRRAVRVDALGEVLGRLEDDRGIAGRLSGGLGADHPQADRAPGSRRIAETDPQFRPTRRGTNEHHRPPLSPMTIAVWTLVPAAAKLP